MRNRALTLKREALAELTSVDLVSVAGAQQQLLTHLTCNPTDGCGHGPSFDQDCPTVPVNYCLPAIYVRTLRACPTL